MTDDAFPDRPDGMAEDFYAACRAVTGLRPRRVIAHILRAGSISNEELQGIYGYTHGPRAARDVREAGVPLETFYVRSTSSGRRVGSYRFATEAGLRRGRVGGRRAFPKRFKSALIAAYGARSTISREPLPERYLQIDHRVPYEVGGDADTLNAADYMLLDASEQRAKSWSCEACDNFQRLRDPAVCRSCFWASPENYSHIAMMQTRRLDVVWRDGDVTQHDALVEIAHRKGLSPQDYLKTVLREALSNRQP